MDNKACLPCSPSFHGSYQPDDVTFLLKPLAQADNLPPLEKEQMIQSGQRHYSEMLTPEKLPSDTYMSLFHEAVKANGKRMAQDCVALAYHIHQNFEQPILVSLARAGTPVGVLIKHLLTQLKEVECNTTQLAETKTSTSTETEHQQDLSTHAISASAVSTSTISVPHYSISIIRDRGIDTNAIAHILKQHKSDGSNLVFIDGWTGKGVITRELTQAVMDYNQAHQTKLLPHLYVLSDLAGVAWQSASFEDYLIPSAILNSTVSGLVSRSILDKQIKTDDFHGCLFYKEFLDNDYSQSFIEQILTFAQPLMHSVQNQQDAILNKVLESATVVSDQELAQPIQSTAVAVSVFSVPVFSVPDTEQKQAQKTQMAGFIGDISSEFGISDVNLIKPGIGEATRVLLRRVPERLIVRDMHDIGIQHLIVLANEKGVSIDERANLPFRAVSLIKSASQ